MHGHALQFLLFFDGLSTKAKIVFFNFTYNHGVKWYAGKIHRPKITLAIIVAAQAVIIFLFFFIFYLNIL